jgi:RNA polymerase sigma factor (sigma-70 family)
MNVPLIVKLDQDRRISAVFAREATRLGRFIRGRVSDVEVAEDILQDVFSELIEAERLVQPIEQVSAWLFRVARNRITDWFRRRKPESRDSLDAEDDGSFWEDALPSPDAGPAALYERARLVDELIEAIDTLPEAQRAVFIANEIDGRSFRELADESGESINTLLSRKHSAVQFLRKRLKAAHDGLNTSEE